MWEFLHFIIDLGRKGGLRAMFMGFFKFLMLCFFGLFSLIILIYGSL